VGSSRKDLSGFPLDVRQVMGFALYLAQTREKHLAAKPLKGFGGAGVLEVVEDYDGDRFRAVYSEIRERGLRAARVSKEVEVWNQDATD
jgi:phage-related protein